MNTKIKNYVEVLFSDIPRTRKAQELKEEILSNLNEHFESYITDGKSENEAYTAAVADLGDIDEMLQSVVPEKELKEKIDAYRQKRARNTSIAVIMYILSIVSLIFCGAVLPDVLPGFSEDTGGTIGVIIMFVIIAAATGIIIYTNMSIPQDIEPYVKAPSRKGNNFDDSTPAGRTMNNIMQLYWLVVTVVYLLISFTTGAWYITWIIWIIGAAVKQAIILFFDFFQSNKTEGEEK